MKYCYAVPSDDYHDWEDSDELKHYGVKGMHWGIRRYQPYKTVPRKSGKTGVYKPTTKAGKAKLWKSKESERQASRYDRKEKVIQTYIDKKTKKLKEAKKSGASDEKISRLKKRIDYGETEKRINSKLKKAELKNIAKMSVNDVSKARLKKGAWYTGQVLKSAAIKATTAAAIGTAIGAFDASKGAALNAASARAAASSRIEGYNAYKTYADNMFKTAQNSMGNTNAFNRASEEFSKASTKAVEMLGEYNHFNSVANRAAAASSALKTLGFGLSATAAGAAVSNFTKLGRINEYSTLSRAQKKQITDSERQAYNRRQGPSKLAKVNQGLNRTGARIGARIYRGTTTGDYYSRFVERSVNRDKKKRK